MASTKNVSSPYEGKSAFGLFSNPRLELMTLLGISILGVIIKICFNTKTDNTGNSGAATATIWGYGITAISLLCIMFIQIGLLNKNMMNSASVTENIGIFLKEHLAIGLLISVLAAIIILYFKFFKRINQGTIPMEFSNFSFLSSLLVSVQLGIFCQYIASKVFNREKQGDKNRVSLSALETIMYLLSVLNAIVFFIMYILLHFYTTDG